MNNRVQQLIAQLRETALLESCGHVLGWDEQTYMPTGGAEHRATQLGMLAGLVHERRTRPELGELLVELEPMSQETTEEAAIIREARRQYDRETRLPRRLVEELSRVTSLAQQNWIGARKKSRFDLFLPWLKQLISLKREQASAIGAPSGDLYDALLDEYEPGMTAAQLAAVFEPLKAALVPLVAALQSAAHRPDVSIVHRHFPKSEQQGFATTAARQIGFDFERGRIDESAHPFCSGLGPGDCRLTTRYDDHHFNSAFFGILHEAGHGIYEQGLKSDQFGTALGQACSLGIHESQSRLWENLVGRSLPFWKHFFPLAAARFPQALGNVALADFHFAINDVRPSFIRVEADEVTYNLHIMMRFELERKLISGELAPVEVPAAWNETFHRYFEMTPPDEAQGCLQDVHWSAGLFGYFPTYALGNMYAAQIFAAAEKALGDLSVQFERGEFEPLKTWLNTEIHQWGKRFSAIQLVERVTGHSVGSTELIEHLTRKYSELYRL